MSIAHSRHSPPSIFPTYLLPSLPFRRRQSSTDSTDSTTSNSSGPFLDAVAVDGARTSDKYLSGHVSHLRCARCAADLCMTSQIISKGFTGRHGRAYLVSASPTASGISTTATTSTPGRSLPNTYADRPMPRQLVTGAHTVSDISCASCGNGLGWKYVAAEEETQRYKVGKFILETRRVSSSSCWENDVDEDDVDGDADVRNEYGLPPVALPKALGKVKEDTVEFDSQDEDECEDLFAGVWSPSLATKRRRGRRFGRPQRDLDGKGKVDGTT